MQALRRVLRGDPGVLRDAGPGLAAAVVVALAAWGPSELIGGQITGPSWLLVLLPVLVGVPLALRRRAPLLMWFGIWGALLLQDVVTGRPAQGIEFILVVFTASYSLGAHTRLRRAALGLAALPVIVAVTRLGTLAFEPRQGGPGGLDLSIVSLVAILAFWLAGVLARARQQAASLTARNAELQRQSEQAVAAERTRIARELHDIVAHHLSVVVLQAAGARACATDPQVALEKIERTGRQALAETRRLLGVLRDGQEDPGLDPQPGVAGLTALADSVRAAGLPVNLVIDGDPAALPAAADVSAYRIVQEALTNVLKHAGPAHADVTIACADDTVTIDVTDNGAGAPARAGREPGHGLAGMRERVAVFGGELHAGPRPGGGFAVRAKLQLSDGAS